MGYVLEYSNASTFSVHSTSAVFKSDFEWYKLTTSANDSAIYQHDKYICMGQIPVAAADVLPYHTIFNMVTLYRPTYTETSKHRAIEL